MALASGPKKAHCYDMTIETTSPRPRLPMVNTEQLRRRLLETFGRDHSVSSLEAAARAAGRDFSQVRAIER